MKGIYCYRDTQNDKIIYVGKDSNIDKQKRRRDHLAPSTYNQQPINRILQNNPSRYHYQILWQIDDCTTNHLNQMEIYFIRKYNPRFNFTSGGDGGTTLSEETRQKMSENHHDVSGSNNPMYGKKGPLHPNYGRKWSNSQRHKFRKANLGRTVPLEECYNKSQATTTTGFFRVYKHKKTDTKKGFLWCYSMRHNGGRKHIYANNLEKLRVKVQNQGLDWRIVDNEKAQMSFLEDSCEKF